MDQFAPPTLMSLPAGRQGGQLVLGGRCGRRRPLEGGLLHRQGVQVVGQLPGEVRDVRVEHVLRRPEDGEKPVRSGRVGTGRHGSTHSKLARQLRAT